MYFLEHFNHLSSLQIILQTKKQEQQQKIQSVFIKTQCSYNINNN